MGENSNPKLTRRQGLTLPTQMMRSYFSASLIANQSPRKHSNGRTRSFPSGHPCRAGSRGATRLLCMRSHSAASDCLRVTDEFPGGTQEKSLPAAPSAPGSSNKNPSGRKLRTLFGPAAISPFIDWFDGLVLNRPERFPLRRFAGRSLSRRRLLDRIQRRVRVLLPRFSRRCSPFLSCRSAFSECRTIFHCGTILNPRTSLGPTFRPTFITSASGSLLRIPPFRNSGTSVRTWGSSLRSDSSPAFFGPAFSRLDFRSPWPWITE